MTLGSNVSNVWSFFNEPKKRKHEVMNGLPEDTSDPKPNNSNDPTISRVDSGISAKRPRIDDQIDSISQTMPNDGPERNWFGKIKKSLFSAFDRLQGKGRSNDNTATTSSSQNSDNQTATAPECDLASHQSSSQEPSNESDLLRNPSQMNQVFDPNTNYSVAFQSEGSVLKKKSKKGLSGAIGKRNYRLMLNNFLSYPMKDKKKETEKPPEVIDLTNETKESESTFRSAVRSDEEPRFKTDVLNINANTTQNLINRIRDTSPPHDSFQAVPPGLIDRVIHPQSQSTPKLWSVDQRVRPHSIATQSWIGIPSSINSGISSQSLRLTQTLQWKQSNEQLTQKESKTPLNGSRPLSTTFSIPRTASLTSLPESCIKFNDEAKQHKDLLDPKLISNLRKEGEISRLNRKLSNVEIKANECRNKRLTDVQAFSPKIREPINRIEVQPFGAYIPYFETEEDEEESHDEEEEDQDEGPSQFPEFTPEMNKLIDAALVPSPPNEVLSQGPTGQICRKDMETLKGLNWLNDEIINFYLSLIVERGKNDNFSSVYAFNTFFYKKLRDSGPQSLKRWTRKVDVFANDFIFIPIHLGMHWCLAVINFVNKKIEYYDSMGGRNEDCVIALKDWVQAERLDKKKEQFPMTDWTLEMVKDIPRQNNGSDCGMFTCKYAEYISRKAKINFSQAHMPYFRRRMVYEIITKQLL